ncbi:hypothetical protein, partial [Actinomadura sp. HBU206391]|uniref:hypothetical protein n=1 Tax=Actinomadura sp. HBU206391 TaxID=2731692 RepID=UPI001650CE4F
ELPVRRSFTIAWAMALLPACAFFGQFALTDAVFPVLFAGWILALHTFLRSARTGAALVASVLAAYAHATHTRGAVILAAHLAVLGMALLRRWGPRWVPVAAAVVTAAGVVAGRLLNDAVLHALYPGGPRDLGALWWTRMTTPQGQLRALSGAAGQIWYLGVGAWGFGAVGLAATGWALAHSRRDLRVTAGALLATTLGIAYASAAALPDEHRVGNYAYGRYLACVAGIYALIGLAVLSHGRPLRAVGGGIAILCCTGAWTVAYSGDRLRRHAFVGFDFPETSFLTGDWTALNAVRASLAAVAILAVTACVARFREVAAAGLAALNLTALTVIGGHLAMPREIPATPASATAGGVAADRALSWRIRVRQSGQIWWTTVRLFDPARERPGPGVCTVLVPASANGGPASTWPSRPAGWRPSGSGAGWVAWRAPSCRT